MQRDRQDAAQPGAGAARASSRRSALRAPRRCCPSAARRAPTAPADARPPAAATATRAALGELIELLQRVDAKYLAARAASQPRGRERRSPLPAAPARGAARSVRRARRAAARFTAWSRPARKFLGDNPDAVYFSAPVRGDRSYRVRGNIAARSTPRSRSRAATRTAAMPSGVVRAERRQLEIARDGSYELSSRRSAGPERLRARARRGHGDHAPLLRERDLRAADPSWRAARDRAAGGARAPPPRPDDAAIAERIRSVANFVRGATLEQPPPDPKEQPPLVSLVPNTLGNPRSGSQEGRLRARSTTRTRWGPSCSSPMQALVIEGRMPRVPLRQRDALEPLPADLRVPRAHDLAATAGRCGSAGRQLPHRGRAHATRAFPTGSTLGASRRTIFWRFLLPRRRSADPDHARGAARGRAAGSRLTRAQAPLALALLLCVGLRGPRRGGRRARRCTATRS